MDTSILSAADADKIWRARRRRAVTEQERLEIDRERRIEKRQRLAAVESALKFDDDGKVILDKNVKKQPPDRKTCGEKYATYAGYQRHVRKMEWPCQPCSEASTRYHAKRKKGEPSQAVGSKKSTRKRANAELERQRGYRFALQERIKKDGGKRPADFKTCGDKRGTYTGAERHYRKGEHYCDECLTAKKVYKRKRSREQKNRKTRERLARIEAEGGKRPADLTTCGDKQGSYTGAERHYRKGEHYCEECEAAKKTYKQQKSKESKNGFEAEMNDG